MGSIPMGFTESQAHKCALTDIGCWAKEEEEEDH